MKKAINQILVPIFFLALFLSTSTSFAMTTLNDQQLDLVTAGATVVTSNRPEVVVRGDVRNEAFIDGSAHVGNVIISDSRIEQRAILINIGNENQVFTGLNVLGVIGRSPSDSLSRGSSPDVSGLRSINQVNNIVSGSGFH